MATPSKEGKKLIEYNCKNGVYNLGGEDATNHLVILQV